MKKLLLILSIFLLTGVYTMYAQPKPPHQRHNWERIDAIRLEFILKKLSLSQSHQDKFVPVYRTYQSEVRKLYAERRKSREQSKANPETQVEKDFYFESRILETKKLYKTKFQEILTPEQLKALYTAEREFKEQLLNQLKGN